VGEGTRRRSERDEFSYSRTLVVGRCEVVLVYLRLAVKDVCNVELRARMPSISNLHCVRLMVCGAARQNRSYAKQRLQSPRTGLVHFQGNGRRGKC
jgi:hypothetical protein